MAQLGLRSGKQLMHNKHHNGSSGKGNTKAANLLQSAWESPIISFYGLDVFNRVCPHATFVLIFQSPTGLSLPPKQNTLKPVITARSIHEGGL